MREGYDALSHEYRSDEFLVDSDYRTWLQELMYELPSNPSVLDLGCGCGLPAARWLSNNGCRVTGIDISPVMIDRAKKLVPRAIFHCCDMMTMGYPANCFDAVISYYAVIHLPLAEQPKLFESVYRWLRPGGLFQVTVGSEHFDGIEDYQPAGPTGRIAPMFWSHADESTYRRMFDELSFEILQSRGIPRLDTPHHIFHVRKL